MAKDAGGTCLTLEALETLRIVDQIRGQYLDRDLAAESSVTRPIDFAHSARAER